MGTGTDMTFFIQVTNLGYGTRLDSTYIKTSLTNQHCSAGIMYYYRL